MEELSPIARPLAEKKLLKKVTKTIKRGEHNSYSRSLKVCRYCLRSIQGATGQARRERGRKSYTKERERVRTVLSPDLLGKAYMIYTVSSSSPPTSPQSTSSPTSPSSPKSPTFPISSFPQKPSWAPPLLLSGRRAVCWYVRIGRESPGRGRRIKRMERRRRIIGSCMMRP